MVDFHTKDGKIGDGLEIDPAKVLEGAKGAGLVQVVVIGFERDGNVTMFSSHGSRETLWMVERAKLYLMLGTD